MGNNVCVKIEKKNYVINNQACQSHMCFHGFANNLATLTQVATCYFGTTSSDDNKIRCKQSEF